MEQRKHLRNAYAGIPMLIIFDFEFLQASRSEIPIASSLRSSLPISSNALKKLSHIWLTYNAELSILKIKQPKDV